MNYKEVQGDLFKGLREHDGFVESLTDTKEVYCHCIANDGKWGAGGDECSDWSIKELCHVTLA